MSVCLSVIIWTRFQPAPGVNQVRLQWYLSRQPTINSSSAEFKGEATLTNATDFTLKVDVNGLQPGTRYYYVFTQGDQYVSPVGMTRTAPSHDYEGQVRFAQMVCSNYRWGWFNAYQMVAQTKDVDFLVFLGDYIYEYGENTYPTKADEVRGGEMPKNEIITLDDYRQRYRFYRTDVNLQELHRRYPAVNVWDDHETSNNAWVEGAENHNSTTEGPWTLRACAGVQAFYEYLPIREPAAGSTCTNRIDNLFRVFQYGKVATVVFAEQRLKGRDNQADPNKDPYILAFLNTPPSQWDSIPNKEALRQSYRRDLMGDPNRELLGKEQVEGLKAAFQKSKQDNITWQVFANTVVMGPLNNADFDLAGKMVPGGGPIAQKLRDALNNNTTPANVGLTVTPTRLRLLFALGPHNISTSADAWSGYLAERNQILSIMEQFAANPIVLSGDVHNAMVHRLGHRLDESFSNLTGSSRSTPIAIDFTCPSITSPGFPLNGRGLVAGQPLVGQEFVRRAWLLGNRGVMDYLNPDNGALIHTLTRQNWHADFFFVDTIVNGSYKAFCDAAFDIPANSNNTLKQVPCTAPTTLFFKLNEPGDPLYGAKLEARAGSMSTTYRCQSTTGRRALRHF